MTTARRTNQLSDYIRSPFISERRRKLFPTDDHDMDSELGHISPICSDETSEDFLTYPKKTVQGSDTPMSNRAWSDTMSPLKLSPCTSSFLRATPRKYSSPSQSLKTPHDTSTKPVLEKEQRTLMEESKSLMKRKGQSPGSSPEHSKSSKAEVKSSKVRTALFPPECAASVDMALSTKSFYSSSKQKPVDVSGKPGSSTLRRETYSYKPIKYSTARHGHRPGRKFGGQINNGVRHKIRKPKQKKMSKAVIAKATKKMLETGAALNEYIQDLSALKSKQQSGVEHKRIEQPFEVKQVDDPAVAKYPELAGGCMKQVQAELQRNQVVNRKQISSPRTNKGFCEANKENLSVESRNRKRSVSPFSCFTPSSPDDFKTATRKFFKSSRANNKPASVAAKANADEEPIRQANDDETATSKKFTLPLVEHKEAEKIILDSGDGFEDDDPEPDAPAAIDDILSALSAESPQKSQVNDYDIFTLDNGHNYIDSTEVASIPNVFDDGEYVQLPISGHLDQLLLQPPLSELASGENNYLYLNGTDTYYTSHDQSSQEVLFENGNVALQLQQEPPPPTPVSATNSSLPNHHQMSSMITLEASSSVSASENSIQLHQQHNVANLILSPISQMCDVTSGLAINSPTRKGARDLTSLLSNMSSRAAKMLSFNVDCCHSVDMEEQRRKLFPVFYKGATAPAAGAVAASVVAQGKQGQPVAERGEKRERGDMSKRSAKRFKALAPDQMLLDAGQKKFGLTLCNECNIVYHMGDPNDEIQHLNYHNAHHVLRFSGWKNEHIVADFQSRGRIIKVLPTDSKIWTKKVKDLMEVVKRDLGCYEMETDISQSQVYLYIKNRTIAGCAVATVPRERGHKMLSSLSGVVMCSEASYPIKCGISHIWVASNFRKQGVASGLLDAVKNNFAYGDILSNSDVALTSPTEAGSAFAEKYFKTPNYLIYYT